MPVYIFRCDRHGRTFEVERAMGQAGDPLFCGQCVNEALAGAPWDELPRARRVFTAPAIVMRPEGWNRRPWEPGYTPSRREAELGEVDLARTLEPNLSGHEVADDPGDVPGYAPGVRPKDPEIPHETMRELHQYAEANAHWEWDYPAQGEHKWAQEMRGQRA